MKDSYSVLVLIIGGVFVLASLILLLRGLRSRAHLHYGAYNVERQEIRRDMLISFSRGAVALLLGIIMFTIYGIIPSDKELQADGPSTPQATVVSTGEAVPTRGATTTSDSTVIRDTPAPPMTLTPIQLPTRTAVESPEPTETAPSLTAIVNSFNGLWLREEPDAESPELELIIDGTVLVILPGREPAGQAEWQQVRTPDGLEGWVFIQFIEYQ